MKTLDLANTPGRDAGESLTVSVVADLLRVPIGTVRQSRKRGTWPKAAKVASHLRCRRRDVDAFVNERTA